MATWPISGAHIDQIAPKLADARNAINAAGVLGKTATILSPFLTPIFLKLSAKLETC